MSFLNKCLYMLVGFVALSLGLWLVTSFVHRPDYVKLIRGGMLVLGLGAIAWGILWHKYRLVPIGLGLLLVGLLSFHVYGFEGGDGLVCELRRSEFGYRLCQFLSHPVVWYPFVPLGYVILGLVLLLNAVMFGQRVPARRIIAVNAILLVGIGLMSMFWPY